jgi:hypothetical protein
VRTEDGERIRMPRAREGVEGVGTRRGLHGTIMSPAHAFASMAST